MNKNIAIIGCPRSGTSLVANLIKTAGYDADMYGTKQLMKPNSKFNPDGYFERIDIVKLNDALIKEIESSLNFLNPPTLQQIQSLFSKNEKLSKIVIEQNLYSGWFIKDSRLAFTLNQYKFNNLSIIKVIRNRNSVKKSMINHYGNLFEHDVVQGPHTIKKINFDYYYDHINSCIDWQMKPYEHITVSYEDILNSNVESLNKFLDSTVDVNIIKKQYQNYAV